MLSRTPLLVIGIALVAAAPPPAAPSTSPAPSSPPAAPPPLTRVALSQSLDTRFKTIDANHDGNLDATEIAALEDRLIQQQIANVRRGFEADFGKLDTNKDGQLSKAEFMAAAPTAPPAKPDGKAALVKFDTNKDGKVSTAEFAAPQLSLFDRIDTNKDGTISPAERQAGQTQPRN